MRFYYNYNPRVNRYAKNSINQRTNTERGGVFRNVFYEWVGEREERSGECGFVFKYVVPRDFPKFRPKYGYFSVRNIALGWAGGGYA